MFLQSIRPAVLGRLVVEAVEAAWDPVSQQVEVLSFLALLHSSTWEKERQAADNLLSAALVAVGGEGGPQPASSESSEDGAACSAGTVRRRRAQPGERRGDPLYSIDV